MKTKTNRILVIAGVVLALALMAVKLVINKREIDKKNAPVKQQDVVITVTAQKALLLPAKVSLVKTGNLLPASEVAISAAAQGKLVEVNYELGTRVVKGEVIAKIDSRMKELALQQIELTLQKLEKDSARFAELYAGNAATEMQLNDILFNYRNAKNQAEQMRKQISDSRILAPISGMVVRKNFQQGEFVNPGMNLGSIVDVTGLKVQVQLSESEVYGVALKQPLTVSADVFPGKTYKGAVTYISPKGDDTHNYLVEVSLKNDEQQLLKAGTFVYADFQTERQDTVLQIPRSALAESLKNPYVYVIEGETAKKRGIKVGRELGENIEVLEGLSDNESVVVSGQINLTDNAKVKVVN